MKIDPFNRKDPLVEAAKSVLVNENVEKIKKRVAQLKVGDKTNYGTVKEIGDDSITFKAPQTPKTKILFKQRKMGKPDYILMSLVKFTDDGKKLDKTFKEAIGLEEKKVTESNEFVGAAAAAKVAGEDEFEFEGETFPTTIGLAVAKKIMGENNEVLESNEFVGAAAAAKVAGEDEFEFEGEKFPTTIGLAVAKKIMGEAFTLEEDTELELKEGIDFSKVADKDVIDLVIKFRTVKGNPWPDFKKDMAAGEKEIKKRRLKIEEATDLEEMTKAKLAKTNKISSDEFSKLSKKPFFNSKEWEYSNKDSLYHRIAEATELSEAEGEEWFTCEVHVKSSGQLYSTFYVLAKDLNSAKKKADKVFKELMKTTYPKDWPSYSKKFTVKVVKGDNIGELMP